MNWRKIHRQIVSTLAAISVIIGSASYANAASVADIHGVKVQINTELIEFPDAQPFIDQNGRLQVPVRFVADRLGMDVDWEMENPESIKTTLSNDFLDISLTTGHQHARINGHKMELDTETVFNEGRVYVPLRFISEMLGIRVQWDQKNQIAILNEDGNYHAPAWYAPKYEKLGTFKATAYSDSVEENGGWGPVDYFGNPLQLGTIAVDPEIIPLGSKVYIKGYEFDELPEGGLQATALDIGGAIGGNRIDIFIPGPSNKVRKFGIQEVDLYIMIEE